MKRDISMHTVKISLNVDEQDGQEVTKDSEETYQSSEFRSLLRYVLKSGHIIKVHLHADL